MTTFTLILNYLQLILIGFMSYCALRIWRDVPRKITLKFNGVELEDNWIPIGQFNEDLVCNDIWFLITDGRNVKVDCELNYNKEGKAVFSKYGSKRLVTHFRPMPEPPKK